MYQVDLSRFAACTIKPILIVDLMRMKEFRRYVDAYDGEITDIWVLRTVRKVEKGMRMTDEYAQSVIEQYGLESLRKHNEKHSICRRILRYLERTVLTNE